MTGRRGEEALDASPNLVRFRTRSTRFVHYVYILRCADDTLYTGYTTDPERRLEEHNAGTGAKYTRGRTPVERVHLETFDSQGAAMRREYAVKQLTRAKKKVLAGLEGS